MRFLAVVALTALLIGGTALAVARGDRHLFVPPPDAVAEGYVRELVAKRWARAQEYREEPAPESELEALQQRIEAAVGEPTKIEAETAGEDDEEALVTVRLSSAKGSEALHFALRFSEGWKVASP